MSYKINGSSASIGAASVRWMLNYVGTDHNGQPVASRYANVELKFPELAKPEDVKQWMNAVSSGSVNLTIPNQWEIGFTDLSGVYVEIMQFPEIIDVHSNQLVLMVKKAEVAL